MNNPSLQNRIEKAKGEIRLSYITPLTPQYGRFVYDYTDESWIPTASKKDNPIVKEDEKSKVDSIS